MTSVKVLVILAGSLSLALFLTALGFQYLADILPCKLCYWQRYPHITSFLAAVVLAYFGYRFFFFVGLCSSLTSGCLGAYHFGIEQNWWSGPDTCTTNSVDGLSVDQLIDQIMSAPLIRCDEVHWELLNLSMAGWNALLSFLISILWILALTKSSNS